MYIKSLQQERDLLQFIQKHHLEKLYGWDNPSGILICQKQNRGWRWQRRDIRDGHLVTTSLRKSEKTLAEELAVNLYRMVCIEYIQTQLSSIDSLIREYGADVKQEISQSSFLTRVSLEVLLKRVRHCPRKPADFFDSQSPYLPFIVSHLQREYAEIIDWYLKDFEQNSDFPEHRVFPVKLGYNVRSKTEVTISDRLFKEGILFHYEEKLFPEGDSYPDFTIPMTAIEKYWWEHFGAMDKENYFHRTKGKIVNYMDHHMYPGINMITTYETRKHPMTEEQVDQKIRWLKYRYRINFPDLPPDESFNMYDLISFVEGKSSGN